MSQRQYSLRASTLAEGIFLGTSGWSYKEWVGPFYSTDEESKIHSYAEVFRAAEIDSTFYAYPAKGLAVGWQMNTPPGFLFTAKLPRTITHEERLDVQQGAAKDLMRFVIMMEPLATSGKLGCLLIQLPPSFAYDPAALENFFSVLPKNISFAVEFRNLSWLRGETWRLLERHNVAYANVDEPLLPPEVHVTADFTYFRWHGRGEHIWFDYRYGKDELEPWVPKIKEAAGSVKATYGFFNNHYHGYAVENCLQVLEMLGQAGGVQREALEKVGEYRADPKAFKAKAKAKERGEGSLDAFMKP
jgi:uncharacterized protein YecE (DUF72 family)